ncbi:MAG: flagellar hook-associated protein FlgL [Firmicutes bacterium]|nr:flagellar hook-associated protein FlgL [Bacillota bacterium]
MRITNNMMNTAFLQDLQRNLRNLDTMQRRINSGKIVSRPSDDPVRLQQILKLETALDQHQQYIRNIDDAHAWLASTDAALDQAGGIIVQVRGLAVQGANGTNDEGAMTALADEVRQLAEQLVGVANATHAGRYIFAGNNTTEKPFQDISWPPDPEIGPLPYDGFQGNSNTMEYEIGPGVTMVVNTTAKMAFGEGDKEAIQLLIDLENALRTDNKDEINNILGKLEEVESQFLTARSEVGARMNRLEATKSRFTDDIITYTALKSQVEDVDMAEAIMYLKTQEAVYHASLAVGARLMQPTLVDFLR